MLKACLELPVCFCKIIQFFKPILCQCSNSTSVCQDRYGPRTMSDMHTYFITYNSLLVTQLGPGSGSLTFESCNLVHASWPALDKGLVWFCFALFSLPTSVVKSQTDISNGSQSGMTFPIGDTSNVRRQSWLSQQRGCYWHLMSKANDAAKQHIMHSVAPSHSHNEELSSPKCLRSWDGETLDKKEEIRWLNHKRVSLKLAVAHSKNRSIFKLHIFLNSSILLTIQRYFAEAVNMEFHLLKIY